MCCAFINIGDTAILTDSKKNSISFANRYLIDSNDMGQHGFVKKNVKLRKHRRNNFVVQIWDSGNKLKWFIIESKKKKDLNALIRSVIYSIFKQWTWCYLRIKPNNSAFICVYMMMIQTQTISDSMSTSSILSELGTGLLWKLWLEIK